jgi:hypothetical protein
MHQCARMLTHPQPPHTPKPRGRRTAGDLLMAACLGRSVYDGDKGGDGDAPPLCVGVEWLRYAHRELAAQQQQRGPAQQLQPEQLRPGERGAFGAGLAAAPLAMSPADAPSAGSGGAGGGGGGSTSGGGGGGAGGRGAAERARAAAAEAARLYERHFGDHDPFWFARRFAERAAINAEAMRGTALQLAAAALGQLPPEQDD